MYGNESTQKIIINNTYFKFIEESGFNEDSYYVGERYTAFFTIINKLAIYQKLLFSTDSLDEIKLENASPLGKREERKLEIQFNPNSAGQKTFHLFLMTPRGKQSLMEKIFYVQTKSNVKIEGSVKKALPLLMKLGKEHEVIFLFTNTGNQAITGVTINIEEIKGG